MTCQWRALYAYATALDALLVDVVGPFFDTHGALLDHGFWERHYAGGPHVRIRVSAEPIALESAVRMLRVRLAEWLAAHAGPPLAGYARDDVARLLKREGVDPATEDLEYRHGVVVERNDAGVATRYASAGARQLAESFKRARGPLALEILRAGARRDDMLFTLGFGLALFAGRGQYAAGSISFKSHWEHFSLSLPSGLLDRFDRGYERLRPTLFDVMDHVEQRWPDRHQPADAFLGRWWQLLAARDEEADAILRAGHVLTRPPSSPESASPLGRIPQGHAGRRSTFVDTLWADVRVARALHHDQSFQRTRALVNLLYELIAAVGASPLDKMTLCHHVFKAVEDRLCCDLTESMRYGIARLLRRYGDALSPTGEALTPGGDQ